MRKHRRELILMGGGAIVIALGVWWSYAVVVAVGLALFFAGLINLNASRGQGL